MADNAAETSAQTTAGPKPDASGSDLWRTALRRRRFLVDRRYQLRAGFIAVGVAVVLLVLLNVALFADASRVPQGETAGTTRVEIGLVALGSLVFLLGVFFVSILETHRSSGAAFRVGQAMEKIRSGRLKTRLRLRRRDSLQELAAAFNAMTGALEERAWEEIEALQEAATRIEGAAGDPAAALEAGRLVRRMAEERRLRID